MVRWLFLKVLKLVLSLSAFSWAKLSFVPINKICSLTLSRLPGVDALCPYQFSQEIQCAVVFVDLSPCVFPIPGDVIHLSNKEATGFLTFFNLTP